MIKKILLTGGHPAPAIALIQKLTKQYPKTDLVFVGKKFDSDKRKTLSFEYQEVSSYKIAFIELNSGRITRIPSIKNLFGIFGFVWGIVNSFLILLSEKPDVVVSFGGYIALPVSIAAYFLGIKVYTHEQTISPGLSNRLIALFAGKIFVAFKEAVPYFPSAKAVYSGNLIRDEIFEVNNKSTLLSNFSSSKPCIYITGGSLGAHSINIHIENILKLLLQSFNIIHQTGGIEEFGDYEKLNRIRETLDDKLKSSYKVMKHILAVDIGLVYNKSDLVIGRSGANTIFELVALSKPSILIPLPWSANGEQLKHAKKLADLGAAEIFLQENSSELLMETVKKAIGRLSYYEKNIKKASSEFQFKGAEVICQEIFSKD